MKDITFFEYCLETKMKRWFKKNWLWISIPKSHYSYILENYVYEKNGELYRGILHCIWYDKKLKFEAVILDILTLENIETIVKKRDCKDIKKVYLLTKYCLKIQESHI